MADTSIFNVEPPAWLQRIAVPIDTKLTGQVLGAALAGATGASARSHEQVQTGTDAEGKPTYGERGGNWFSNFLGAAGDARMNMIDPMWRYKANALQVDTLKDMVGLATANQDLLLKREQLAGRAKDSARTGWFSLTPEQRAKTPMPAFETPEYLSRGIAQQQSDSHWLNEQTNSFIAKEYAAIRSDLLTRQGDAGIAAVAALPPPQGPAPTAQEYAAIKAAQASVSLTNRTRDFTREQQAINAGMVPSLTMEPTPNSRVTYTPRTASGTAGATTFRQRFLRAQEIDAAAVAPWANILGEPSPEAMTAFTAVETPLLAKAQSSLATAAGTPGASGTYGRTGLQSATVSQERLYTGGVPPVVQLSDGDQLIPKARYRSDGRIEGYDIVMHSASGTDRLVTPQTLLTMATELGNQLTFGRGMTPAQKTALGERRDAYNKLAEDIVNSMEPALRDQIQLRKEGGGGWRGVPHKLPASTGTNAPTSGGSTNAWTISPDGQVILK